MGNLLEVFIGKAKKIVYNGIQTGSGGTGNAARLYDNRGKPIVRDRCESVLRRWVKQLRQERVGITPQSKALTSEQQKIKELEARIDRLERGKVILKRLPLS